LMALKAGPVDIVAPAAEEARADMGLSHRQAATPLHMRIGGPGRNVMLWLVRPVVGVPWVLKRTGVVPVFARAGLRGAGHLDIWIRAGEGAASSRGIFDLTASALLHSPR